MGICPFYKECKRVKNSGICEDSNQLLLCKTYNKFKKEMEIRERAKQISDRQKLKKGKKIRL